MKRFAVDVVLLPPEPVMDLILGWNEQLVREDATNITLNKNDRLPHISMVMGCVASHALLQADTILKAITTKHKRLKLLASGMRTIETPGHQVVTLDFSSSYELLKLHESIVNDFRPLLSQDTKTEDVFDAPPINPSTLEWINRFVPHQCYENFWPHITLGFGKPMASFTSFTFDIARVAICHLGNHCTCRKILAEASLA